MKIRGTKTIEEYKEVRNCRIQEWIDERFVSGSVTWTLNGNRYIKITDNTGDSLLVALCEIN